MSKIIQLTSGRGPAECCWVVAQVLKVMMAEAKRLTIDSHIINSERGQYRGTVFSATIKFHADEEVLDDFLKSWIGTIQWIGKSEFRIYHRRKNWFIGVKDINVNSSMPKLKNSDVKYAAVRSGGPGGQHVNKVSTAIRAIHIPTGISVKVSDGRSQLQNRKKAIERLTWLFDEYEREQMVSLLKSNWQNHNELERGNPIRIYEGRSFRLKSARG